ncbi:MAG TPA: hypothetical protein DCS93_17070 [Microscillaceae bacterium]|nr:hypothetical protein [Microscillaceae bacterium]
MKNRLSAKKTDVQLWKKYLANIHQEQGTEPANLTSQKFWKNYESLIQQSQKQRVIPLPQAPPTIVADQMYQEIFLKYWNGVSSTVTYDQEVPVTPPPKSGLQRITIDPKHYTHLFRVLGFLGLLGVVTILLDIGIGGFFALLIVSIHLFSFIAEFFPNKNNDNQITQNKPIAKAITQYTFQINADHLIFTRIDQHKIKKILRLDYYKVKSLMVHDSELRLKSLYHHSLSDRLKGQHIKEYFCIPVSMPQGKEITDFLREILILNKT